MSIPRPANTSPPTTTVLELEDLEKSIARQMIYAIMFETNMPAMIVGEELETALLLMLSDQESKARH